MSHPLDRFATRAMLKNEQVDSLLTAQNVQSIFDYVIGDNVQDVYMACLEIIEDMHMHGVPKEFFADAIKQVQLEIPLAHHVAHKNSEAIETWEAEAKSGTVLRII